MLSGMVCQGERDLRGYLKFAGWLNSTETRYRRENKKGWPQSAASLFRSNYDYRPQLSGALTAIVADVAVRDRTARPPRRRLQRRRAAPRPFVSRRLHPPVGRHML